MWYSLHGLTSVQYVLFGSEYQAEGALNETAPPGAVVFRRT
ncbi:MAG: hypothetical protein ACJ8R9_20460 [Steroidobacteraceae bacterium]